MRGGLIQLFLKMKLYVYEDSFVSHTYDGITINPIATNTSAPSMRGHFCIGVEYFQN